MESNTKHKKTFRSKPIERVCEETLPWHKKRLLSEHRLRYQFVQKYLKDKIVLDIACGNGFGSYLLAHSGAKFVYGIDNSKQAINFAEKNNQTKNIRYIVGDAQNLKLKDNHADVVVSLETIEHLKAPHKFVSKIKRVLKPGGVFIISTPNRETSYEDNPYHIKEFTLQELDDLLSGFTKMTYYGQRPLNKIIIFLYKYFYKKFSEISPLSNFIFFLKFRPWESQKIRKLKDMSDTSYMYFIVVCRK